LTSIVLVACVELRTAIYSIALTGGKHKKQSMFPVEALHGNAYFAKQAYVFNDISLGIIGATIDWKIVYFLGNAG